MTTEPSRDTVARDLFVQRLRDRGHEIESDNVIARENVYRVDGKAHLMVRTSRYHQSRGIYFFGLTRHIFENFAQLPNAVIAFVFADTSTAITVPAPWLWEQRAKLSSDHKQYKLEVDPSLRLKVPGRTKKAIDLSMYRDDSETFRRATEQANLVPETNRRAFSISILHFRGFFSKSVTFEDLEPIAQTSHQVSRAALLGRFQPSRRFPNSLA